MTSKIGAFWLALPCGVFCLAGLYAGATITVGFVQFGLLVALFALCGLGLVVMVFRRASRGFWLLVPVVLLATPFGFVASEVPERAVLSLIDDDLRGIAESGKVGRAGPYRVVAVEREGSAVLLQVAGTGWIFSHGGFVYAPGGPATIPALGEGYESLDYWHISGAWYEYYMVES
ncbi:hypothetical protein GCM10027589_41010 [Actinocorallia lasiicapitis]